MHARLYVEDSARPAGLFGKCARMIHALLLEWAERVPYISAANVARYGFDEWQHTGFACGTRRTLCRDRLQASKAARARCGLPAFCGVLSQVLYFAGVTP